MSQGPRVHHRLLYDGIELLPVTWVGMRDLWHLPGGKMATTEDLIRRANARNIQVSKLSILGLDREIEPLN